MIKFVSGVVVGAFVGALAVEVVEKTYPGIINKIGNKLTVRCGIMRPAKIIGIKNAEAAGRANPLVVSRINIECANVVIDDAVAHANAAAEPIVQSFRCTETVRRE